MRAEFGEGLTANYGKRQRDKAAAFAFCLRIPNSLRRSAHNAFALYLPHGGNIRPRVVQMKPVDNRGRFGSHVASWGYFLAGIEVPGHLLRMPVIDSRSAASILMQ